MNYLEEFSKKIIKVQISFDVRGRDYIFKADINRLLP